MKQLTLTLPGGAKPRFLRIAEAVRTKIRQGALLPGEAIPSTREIARMVGVHRHTAAAALDELVAEGWVAGRCRSAFRVAETLPTRYFSSAGPAAGGSYAQVHRWSFARPPAVFSAAGLPRHDFDFTTAAPDSRLFPQREFRSCLNDAIRNSGLPLFDYGDPRGHPPFLAELGAYLRRVRSLFGREIVVTHGSHEAIFLISQLLVGPGDRVGVEALGYPAALAAFRAAGAALVPIRVDRHGVDPGDLERALRRKKMRLLYLTPLHQFPTTVTIPISRRLQIYRLACEHDVVILEDDFDHEFHYESQPLPPLASDDPAGRVLYVSSLSKIFAPSARLGFVCVPPQVASRLANLKYVVSRQNDLLTQDAMVRWMRSGGFERHLRRTRRENLVRRDALDACLRAVQRRGLDWSWSVPDGGTAIWADTGGDSAKLAERAGRHGILLSPEALFRVKGGRGSGFRIPFSRYAPAELEEAVGRLAECCLGL